MNTPVRYLHPYYEVDGQFAVDRYTADSAYNNAAEIVGQHAGQITVHNLLGVRIPTDRNPIALRQVNLPPNMHNGLITGRHITAGTTTPGIDGAAAVEGLGYQPPRSLRVGSTIVMAHFRTGSSQEALTLNLARVIGTSFGLLDCSNVFCIMQPNGTEKTFPATNPFCDGCAEDLELAGYRALGMRQTGV